MAPRWLPLLLALALPPLLSACGPRVPPSVDPVTGKGRVDPDRMAAERQRLAETRAGVERQRAEERCLRERPALETRMAALRRAEGRLARVKAETYVSLPPPPPWDEAAESRFRQEDRDADWLRHQQAQESWRREDEGRRVRWWADHQARLGEAQAELNAEARALRERRADLFTGVDSIEFNPVVEAQIRQCRNLAARPMGKTTPP
jgi:hypothetical protein